MNFCFKSILQPTDNHDNSDHKLQKKYVLCTLDHWLLTGDPWRGSKGQHYIDARCHKSEHHKYQLFRVSLIVQRSGPFMTLGGHQA